MSWTYDSGGKSKYQDKEKYAANYERIFGKPCKECGMKKGKHKLDCSQQYKD